MPSTINATATSSGLTQAADSSGSLALQTVGVTAVTIDSSQNVGIGTTTPTRKLDVVGTQAVSSSVGTVPASPSAGELLALVNLNSANTSQQKVIMMGASPLASGIGNNASSGYVRSPGNFSVYTGGPTPLEQFRLTETGLLYLSTGLNDVYLSYVGRAWINFNGTGTPSIRASGNISSITDNGTGDYTLNFSNSMPNTNYSVIGATATDSLYSTIVSVFGTGSSNLVGSCRIVTLVTTTGSNVDMGMVSVMIVR